MSEDQAKQVKADRDEANKRAAAAAEAPKEKDVQAKLDKGEALTFAELEAINTPASRPHNDEAEIGFRTEPISGYAPAAQPDLHAPAYVLEQQAKLAAEGHDDTRAGVSTPQPGVDEPANARLTKSQQKAQQDAEEKAAAKKAESQNK
jgi:hypothetical protein